MNFVDYRENKNMVGAVVMVGGRNNMMMVCMVISAGLDGTTRVVPCLWGLAWLIA